MDCEREEQAKDFNCHFAFFERGSMMKKTAVVLTVVLAVLSLVSISSASVTVLGAGQTGICENAAWVVTNQDEQKDTQLVYNVGPIGYGWGKDVTRT